MHSGGISLKIWLAIVIMQLPLIIIMLHNDRFHHEAQQRTTLVADHFMPAALHAQNSLALFTEQLTELQAAKAAARSASAAGQTSRITSHLEAIIASDQLPATLTAMAAETLRRYQRFTGRSLPPYDNKAINAHQTARPTPTDALLAEGRDLLHHFSRLAESGSELVGRELHAIAAPARRGNMANLIFLAALIMASCLLVVFFLRNAISRPLHKTVVQANQMAAGNFSHTLEIRQNDEIGALARAMNSMAARLEDHHQALAEAVDEKTTNLQKTNKQLLMEVQQRINTQHELLLVMNEAEKANRAKSSFLTMMSHELRTPMNGIIGMSSLILDSAPDNTQRRYATTIRNSAETLLAILNDILDYSKIEANKLALESFDFDIRTVMDDISDLLSPQAEEKGLQFFTLTDPVAPTLLKGDANRLSQVLFTLVGNAVKFTQRGEVALRMEVVDSSNSTVTMRFAVSDTGICIAEHQLRHLFAPFTQADTSTARQFGGTGLGLAISQRLVQLMGGELKAESTEGEGSTFWFTATFSASGHLGRPQPAAAGRSLIYHQRYSAADEEKTYLATGSRILVADADNTSLLVAEAILESFGSLVHVAHTGKETISLLQAGDYDLLFLDMQIAEASAMEVATTIRNWRDSADPLLQAKSKTPIIGLTVDISDAARRTYLAAGVNDCLDKPLRPRNLAARLQQWLAGTGTRQARELRRPLFDRQLLLKRLKGDQQRLEEVILAARIAIPNYLAELEMADKNQTWAQAHKKCHEIKDMACRLGVASLQHHALHLCMALDNNDQALSRHHYEHLKEMLLDLRRSLQ